LDRIDIQHGRVVAPMNTNFPKRAGVVEKVLVTRGQAVHEGDILIRMYDPKLQADLSDTEARMTAAAKAYDDVKQALIQLDGLTDTDAPVIRMATASRYHAMFIGSGQFDDMRRQWLALRDQRAQLADTFDPVSIVREMLAAELTHRQADIDSLHAQHTARLDLIALNHITAPSDGIVQEVLVHKGQPVSASPAPLAFESTEPRVTIGWVSERFAETMFIGMPASIGLNEGAERIKFTGTVTDLQAGDHPERPGEFGIIVTVTPADLSAAGTKARLRAGAPVNLDAKRHIGQRLTEWFVGLVNTNG
ncbi:biotin/lipoyl-binding protein, partial [uncultured Tateyamaria sp.]